MICVSFLCTARLLISILTQHFKRRKEEEFDIRMQRITGRQLSLDSSFKLLKLLQTFCGEHIAKNLLSGNNEYYEIRISRLLLSGTNEEIEDVIDAFVETEEGKGTLEYIDHVYLDNVVRDGAPFFRKLPHLQKGTVQVPRLGGEAAISLSQSPPINMADYDGRILISDVENAIDYVNYINSSLERHGHPRILALDLEWDRNSETGEENPPLLSLAWRNLATGKIMTALFRTKNLRDGEGLPAAASIWRSVANRRPATRTFCTGSRVPGAAGSPKPAPSFTITVLGDTVLDPCARFPSICCTSAPCARRRPYRGPARRPWRWPVPSASSSR